MRKIAFLTIFVLFSFTLFALFMTLQATDTQRQLDTQQQFEPYDLLGEISSHLEADSFNPAIRENECDLRDKIHSCRNSSKIFHVYGDRNIVIEDSILLGVYAHENSSVLVRNSTIFRAAEFDDATLKSEKSDIFYNNDHLPRLEKILDDILRRDMSDKEKVMSIHRWVNNSINHSEDAVIPDVAKNFNVYIILERMDGDCGAHSAIFGALTHFAGFPSRGIEARHHFVTEVFFDGRWHMIDSDPSTEGRFFIGSGGRILNAYEMFENPDLYEKDYFHVWDPKLGRYFGMGIGQISIDTFQMFYPLNQENKGIFKQVFYDNGWLYFKSRHRTLEVYEQEIMRYNEYRRSKGLEEAKDQYGKELLQ